MRIRVPTSPKFQVKIKKSSAGLGLFTMVPIKKGQKIIEYGGRIISDEEANRRGGKYLFDINDSDFTIDGSPRWNIARYINHACKPNSEAVWYGNKVWICSKKDIRPNEELTYHYGPVYFQEMLGGRSGCMCHTCLRTR